MTSIDFFSKKFDLAIYGDDNGNISLFSTKTNKIVWTNKDSVDRAILSVSVDPNDEIVAGGGEKKCLIVINATNGNSICFVDVGSIVWRVLFLSHQEIVCGLQNGTVAIVCWQTQCIEKILNVGERSVYALSISPINNDILLTGDYDGVIKQIIISSKKTVMVYEGHTDNVFDLKFLSCGSMFVSGSLDETSRLFALDQKQAIRVFQGHSFGVRFISLIHDDELLITTSLDTTMKVWNVDNGECLSTVTLKPGVYCGAISKNEESIVVGRRYGVFGKKITILPCPPRFAVSLDRKLKLVK